MTTFTIHAEDALANALRGAARDAGTSINFLIKETMSAALGLVKSRRKPPSFMRFAGRLPHRDAEAMRTVVDQATFSQVDEEDWR